MSECWVVCDSAVLPHAAHRIHPVIGPHQGHSFPHLALVSQGREANRKMGIPMLSSKWIEHCSNMTTQDHTRIVIKCLPSNVFLCVHSKLVKYHIDLITQCLELTELAVCK